MATINGTAGDDTLNGTKLADQINAYGGDDFLYGRDGNDRLSVGPGYDFAVGGSGADTVLGGSGIDKLYGDDPNIDGPEGNDTIYGGSGTDALYGEGGNDLLSGDDGGDELTGGPGLSDRLTGGNGNDYLDDGDGASAWGDAGDDLLFIGAGSAHGGIGNDSFGSYWSTTGKVTWTGDADADTFHAEFNTNDGRVGHLTIADFSRAQGDHITIQENDAALDRALDQATLLAALDSNHDGRLAVGDNLITQGTGGLSIHWGEDTVTLAHMASIDLTMFG